MKDMNRQMLGGLADVVVAVDLQMLVMECLAVVLGVRRALKAMMLLVQDSLAENQSRSPLPRLD